MSDVDVDPLGRELGRAIRQARNDAGISMRALATRSGLSQPFLSAVERGLSMPSIATLYRIAAALDVSPSTLLPVSASGGDIQVVRAEEGRLVASSERPGSALGRVVFSDEHQGLEVFEYVVDESADLDVWYADDGRKVLHLVEGHLTVEFEGHAAAHLGPGDCLVHAGRIPHRWSVASAGRVRLFLVIVREPS